MWGKVEKGTKIFMGGSGTHGGALVVSGMAQGIDAASIRGALMAGGTVVSVLAGGLDVIYPRYHRFLYEDVAASGLLLSEYPPGTEHKGSHFPVRNRIISGLYSEKLGDSSSSEFFVPTQFSHNLSLAYSVSGEKYNISFECRNFTNEKLYDNFSLQKAGRAFYGKIRVYFNGK